MVNFKDKDLEENEKYLNLVNSVYRGVRDIKSKTYLTQYDLEEDSKYLERLENATLYNFLKKSVDNLSSVLFRKSLKVDYKVKNEKFIKNIDGKGSSLNQFSKEVSREALKDGLAYIWVDSQRVDQAVSVSNIDNIQPYLKLIKRENVYSKKIVFENGLAVLKQIVFNQTIDVEKDGEDFETVEKEIYIVLTENGGKIWSLKDGSKEVYEEIDSWENTLGLVPVIPIYSAKTGFLEADIPLLDLAFMNLKHFNSQSNLDSILRLAAVPVPIVYSDNEFDKNTLKKEGLTIGVNKALAFNDKSKEGFEFVEIQGNSIDKLENNLIKIEESMDKMALSVLTSNSFNTATEAKIADSNSNLFLMDLAMSLEDGLNSAFKIMELYIGIKLDITVSINKDFESLGLDAQTIDKYISLKREGLISIDTLWDELIKGEVLNISDYDVEKQKITDELNTL